METEKQEEKQEKTKQYYRVYYEKHRAELLEKMKIRKQTNPRFIEIRRRASKKHYERHKEHEAAVRYWRGWIKREKESILHILL